MGSRKSRCVIGIDSNIKAVKGSLFNYKKEQLSQTRGGSKDYPFGKYYHGKSNNCGVFWLINEDDGSMKLNSCGQFSCQRCFHKKVAGLREDLTQDLREYNLGNRLDMTLPGKEFRSKISAEESYHYGTRKQNQITKAIRRTYGDFEYIRLNRSQKDGYWHSHTFFPKDLEIDPKWMEKRARANGVGWCRFKKKTIEKNVHYVCCHFTSNPKKIGEFYLPKGIRHVTTSENVTLSHFEPSGQWKKVDTRDITRLTKKNEYEVIRPVYRHYTGMDEVPIEPFFGAFCQMIDEKVFDFNRVM